MTAIMMTPATAKAPGRARSPRSAAHFHLLIRKAAPSPAVPLRQYPHHIAALLAATDGQLRPDQMQILIDAAAIIARGDWDASLGLRHKEGS